MKRPRLEAARVWVQDNAHAPKKIDSELKASAVRLVSHHLAEYPNVTAASISVAKQLGVRRVSVRPWVAQGEVDARSRAGVTREEL